mgnify:CR=1 FL=1
MFTSFDFFDFNHFFDSMSLYISCSNRQENLSGFSTQRNVKLMASSAMGIKYLSSVFQIPFLNRLCKTLNISWSLGCLRLWSKFFPGSFEGTKNWKALHVSLAMKKFFDPRFFKPSFKSIERLFFIIFGSSLKIFFFFLIYNKKNVIE